MTSISMAQDVYVQNHKKLKDYYTAPSMPANCP
jgi:coproporphyrinogen III oxidase-like Fe-S oxidoreductase